MPLIRNDKTYSDRVKYQNSKIKKREIPAFVFITLILYFIFEKVDFFDLLLLSGAVVLWLVSTIDMIKKPPHPNIPDDYTKGAKTLMFVGMWIMGSIVLIFIGDMIFNKYYA